jgi:oxygen-independent coproporphyrinogen-3 oxidase
MFSPEEALQVADLVKKHAAPVPRYTSYPTAPHFSPAVGDVHYVSWLAALPAGSRLSLYVHVPFCHSLCWYCGCNTKATHRYAPVAAYFRSLLEEIANVGRLVPQPHTIQHIHWGGGSPNILAAGDIAELAQTLRARFSVGKAAEFAVEIDPRHLDSDKLEAFAGAGVTRVSIGVQDFDTAVQASIGRMQSFQMTKAAIDGFRRHGVGSINIDLMYGLPRQTVRSVERTVTQVLELAPDRIAVFGYAHLPARMKHQRLLAGSMLPDALERFAQATSTARQLTAAGYVEIGLDHFARPDDPLAAAGVRRNFQGYTTDKADALLGLGASAIGRLPQGYVQNAVAAGDYARRIQAYGVATARGLALTGEDKVRGYVIERLMCDLTFSTADLIRKFGWAAEAVLDEARELIDPSRDGLIEHTADGFRVTERGRPFLRSIAAHFDAYLGARAARHAAGV